MGEAADIVWDHDYLASEHDRYCERHKNLYPYGHCCSMCEEGEPPVFCVGDEVMFSHRAQQAEYPMEIKEVNGEKVLVDNKWWYATSFISYKQWKKRRT